MSGEVRGIWVSMKKSYESRRPLVGSAGLRPGAFPSLVNPSKSTDKDSDLNPPPRANPSLPPGKSNGWPVMTPSASHSSDRPLWNKVVLRAFTVLAAFGPVVVGKGAVGEKKISYWGTKFPDESLSWLRPCAASAGSGFGFNAKSSAAPLI